MAHARRQGRGPIPCARNAGRSCSACNLFLVPKVLAGAEAVVFGMPPPAGGWTAGSGARCDVGAAGRRLGALAGMWCACCTAANRVERLCIKSTTVSTVHVCTFRRAQSIMRPIETGDACQRLCKPPGASTAAAVALAH